MSSKIAILYFLGIPRKSPIWNCFIVAEFITLRLHCAANLAASSILSLGLKEAFLASCAK